MAAQITSANQLALQSKAQLEATGAFVVEPDGRVRMTTDRGGGYMPPWVWAPALTDDNATRISLATPSSDPKSPWRSAVPYSEGGPFTKHSSWDQKNGTYDGGIDWGTLLGTIGVGAIFATPALAAAFSASGGAAAAGTGTGVGVGETAATAGIPSATALGLPTTAGLGTAGAAAPVATAAANSPWLSSGNIPAEFGTNAVDTVASPAASGSGGFFARAGQFLRPGGSGSKGTGVSGLLDKYALPAISGVFNNLAANRRNQDVLQQRESELDPYRGQMHQASDVARLDQMATGDFRATPTEITGRYAHSYEPNSPWLPSDTVRNVAAQGEMQVANGQGAELGDPLPRVRYAGQTPAALLAAAARKRRLVPDDENSPWLTGAA